MTNKLPALQFYPGDWRKDVGVQSLTFHDRGVWFEMLMLMHESDIRGQLVLNGKPMPEEALARLLGLDINLLKQTLTTLLDFGIASVEPSTGAISCRRMMRDEKLRKTRAEAGKRGGNPVLLKQIPTTRVKQISTPSSSSSSSNTSGALDASLACIVVLEKCGLSKTRSFLEAVGDQAKLAAAANEDLVMWAELAVQAYRDYEESRPSLNFPVGTEKFFATGLYRHREKWKYKEGMAPIAKRKYWTPEANA